MPANHATSQRVDLFDSTYSHFTEQVLDAVRKETFGEDIGQNSWLTRDEYDVFIGWLRAEAGHRLLEVASGSGGPACYLVRKSGCHVTGIDSNEHGIATASRAAVEANLTDRLKFIAVNANERLPFVNDGFDALLCIDSMNHFPDRLSVFREWARVLRPGGRAVFTDPVVISGPVTNDELALRSSIGLFLFVPDGLNEQFIESAGLRLVRREDVTENAAMVSERWRRARHHHCDALLRIEGRERFEGLQRFFAAVHRLTSERRLSRIAYLVEKRAA
jgi:SAM-dependent methyltransferase